MTDESKTNPSTRTSSDNEQDSEEMIRQLEQVPVEVLEAVLLIFQIREAREKS